MDKIERMREMNCTRVFNEINLLVDFLNMFQVEYEAKFKGKRIEDEVKELYFYNRFGINYCHLRDVMKMYSDWFIYGSSCDDYIKRKEELFEKYNDKLIQFEIERNKAKIEELNEEVKRLEELKK